MADGPGTFSGSASSALLIFIRSYSTNCKGVIGPRIYPRCEQRDRLPRYRGCQRRFRVLVRRLVHLDIDVIEAYFRSMHRILKPSGCAVIQYSDKNKEAARKYGQGFASDTTPEIIRPLVVGCGHRILEEDITTVWHSSIVRFAPIPYPEETSNSQDEMSKGA